MSILQPIGSGAEAPAWMAGLRELAGRRKVRTGALLVGLAILFFICVWREIAFSEARSRLAMPPGYDDVTYLLDAMQRYVFDVPRGFWTVWANVVNNPPHAPSSTLTAMMGFALFGTAVKSAYLANGWILAVYIATIAVISRPLGSVVRRLLFVAAFQFARASQAMITEFRPDLAAGLVFAIALVLITSTDFGSASLRRRVLLALVAVAATVLKPSGIVIVVPGLGIALFAALFFQTRERHKSWASLTLAALPAAVLYLVLLVPFALIWGESTAAYIYQALVTNSDVWKTEGGFLIHWTYHLFGYGATKALSPFNFIGLAVIFFDIRRLRGELPNPKKTAAYALYAAIAVIYVSMALSIEKSPFQGSYFYLPFLLAVAMASVRLLLLVRPQWRVTAGLAVAILLLEVVRPYGSSFTGLPNHAAELPSLYSQATDRLSALVKDRPSCQGQPPILLVATPDPLAAESLSLALVQRHQSVEPAASFLARSEAEIATFVKKASFVLITDPGISGQRIGLPGAALAPWMQQQLATSPEWTGDPIGFVEGKPIWLFVRSGCPVRPP